MAENLKKFSPVISRVKGPLLLATFVVLLAVSLYSYQQVSTYRLKTESLSSSEKDLKSQLEKVNRELIDLKNQDQVKINQELKEEIKNIEATYKQAVAVYEQLLDLKEKTQQTEKLDEAFTKSLTLLSERNFASAAGTLTQLTGDIAAEKTKIAEAAKPKVTAAESNSPPGSGYKRQYVDVGGTKFLVDIIAADLNSSKVIVDTASDGTCTNDCLVLPLADYANRSGAFAAVNGPYFCPATYPSCSGKTNSFDTLLMNKSKVYFNSENNVYSSVPAVIFYSNTARFVRQSLEWGRDTGVDAVIANQPLLVFDGNITFSDPGDAKQSSKGGRAFIGTTDATVYIGVVHNASVAEAAQVLHALGIKNALNLDNGGSTALWNGRYLVGPGRNLPFGVLLVGK